MGPRHYRVGNSPGDRLPSAFAECAVVSSHAINRDRPPTSQRGVAMPTPHRRNRWNSSRRPRPAGASPAAGRRRLRPLGEALESRALLTTYAVDSFVDASDGDYGAGHLSL